MTMIKVGQDDFILKGTEYRRLLAAEAKFADMLIALKECADELADELEGRYAGTKNHPAVTPKYKRDMETVVRARAVIARAQGKA